MSKKIVKSVRASVDYLLQVKATAPVQMQEVIDFLLESAFFDRDDDFFETIVQAENSGAEKYQWFNGMRYTRQEDGHYRGYHGKYLHRAVWEYYNGKIPKNYVIHHRDFNPANNDISNLQLMTRAEHKKIHNAHRAEEVYICEYCGKEFSDYKYSKKRYCSKECVAKVNSRNHLGKKFPRNR